MWTVVWIGPGIALLIFIAVIIMRTLQFKPAIAEAVHPVSVQLNKDKIVTDMAVVAGRLCTTK